MSDYADRVRARDARCRTRVWIHPEIPFMHRRAVVITPRPVGGQSVRDVKNLGWLLRNWRKVDTLEAVAEPLMLIAYMTDGRVYATEWADRSILAAWLDRPVFRGAPIKWFGVVREVQKGMT